MHPRDLHRDPRGRALVMGVLAAMTSLLAVTAFAAPPPAGGSLNLMVNDTGIAFGHAPRVNGLRVNFQDRSLERVNGINLTLWSPAGRGDVGGEVNGFALGLVGPAAARMHGVQAGLVAVVASERLAGLSVGGIAVVSEQEQFGLAFAGLAVVSEGRSTGIGAGGLAYVSEGNLGGVHVGGLATVAEGHLDGIHLGGLATVAEGHLRGLGAAGLATVTEGVLTGIGAGGLATVATRLQGIGIGGLAVATTEEMRGLALAGATTGAGDLTGLAVAPYNRYEGVQRGITIGIFNWADELRGIQIGLLNRADNNPPPFRWLPLLNASF